LLLSAARERSQQQNRGNVPISEEVHIDQLLSAVLDDISALSGWPFLWGRGPSTAVTLNRTGKPRRPSAAATGNGLDAADALAPGTTRSHTDAGSSVHNAPAGAKITAKARVQTHYAFVKDERCCGDSHSTETLPYRISDREIPNALLGHYPQSSVSCAGRVRRFTKVRKTEADVRVERCQPGRH
jgi:hypothetical protein